VQRAQCPWQSGDLLAWPELDSQTSKPIALALDGFSIENINDGGHRARTVSKAGRNQCQNSIDALGVLPKVAVKKVLMVGDPAILAKKSDPRASPIEGERLAGAVVFRPYTVGRRTDKPETNIGPKVCKSHSKVPSGCDLYQRRSFHIPTISPCPSQGHAYHYRIGAVIIAPENVNAGTKALRSTRGTNQTRLGLLPFSDSKTFARVTYTWNKCSFCYWPIFVIPPPYGLEHETQKLANVQPHERSILETPNLQANETKMTTNALADWQTVRSARLNELAMVIGPTDRLDLIEVLVMRLAAEWQGFVRQFHDEITALFVTRCGLSGTLAQVASGLITYRREIDVGNASADALANDLSAFGIDLWTALANEHTGTKNPRNKGAATVEQMKRTLTILNQARNAAAHDDETRRQKMRQAGIILSVTTMVAWQNLLSELAEALDQAVTKQVEFPE
jgi:hypothetical protein